MNGAPVLLWLIERKQATAKTNSRSFAALQDDNFWAAISSLRNVNVWGAICYLQDDDVWGRSVS